MYKQVVKWVMWTCIILGMSVFTINKCSAQEVKSVVQVKMYQATQLHRQGYRVQANQLVNETVAIMLGEVRSGNVQPWMREGINIAMKAAMHSPAEIEKIMNEVDLQISIKKTADTMKLISNPPEPAKGISGSELHQHLRNLDDSKATREFLRARHRSVGYRPIITWLPQGTMMSAGPVIVSPDRRYVRVGINTSFSSVTGFHTFNYHTGQSRWYPNNR